MVVNVMGQSGVDDSLNIFTSDPSPGAVDDSESELISESGSKGIFLMTVSTSSKQHRSISTTTAIVTLEVLQMSRIFFPGTHKGDISKMPFE